MTQTVEEALREFHTTYGLSVSDKPVDIDPGSCTQETSEIWELRDSLHREEFSELIDAMDRGNLIDLADAICDLVYVVVGTAVSFGIPFDRCFQEVQASNMSKLGEDGKPIVREDGKILKGPNFFKPNLERVIYGRH